MKKSKRMKKMKSIAVLFVIAALILGMHSYIYADETNKTVPGTDASVSADSVLPSDPEEMQTPAEPEEVPEDAEESGQDEESEQAGESGQDEESEQAEESGKEEEPDEASEAEEAAEEEPSDESGKAEEPEKTDESEKPEKSDEKKPVLADAMESCDFAVTGADGSYSFDPETGVLTVTGDVTIGMKEGKTSTTQSIFAAADCKVTINGINISAAAGPAMLIKSPYKVTLVLEGENKLAGANGVNINHIAGSFAAVEVEFEYEDGESPSNKKASLTIEGTGSLNATGGRNAAGIGGSNSAGGSIGKGLYGNITINSGTITAVSPGNGAGIGSSDNPGDGTSTGSFKKTGHNVWGTITINGGTVNATSASGSGYSGNGAGIGGGNHVDSGKIIINGGTVTAHGAAGIGCGIGSSKNKGYGLDKGPGYYWADVEIHGGNITATSNDIGAAIGGGMYCDAVVVITDGVINATGGSRQGNTHHGGAGIGGGYLGHADIKISGGEIHATGGDGAAGIGSGGSPNSKESRGENGRSTEKDVTKLTQTTVAVTGGNIEAYGGVKGGAGIGLGVGADKGSVTITGGTVYAAGGKSSEAEKHGGAGIGSGFQGTGTGNEKYFVDADIRVTVTDGTVVAIGGWGASGIGSGAENKMAEYIEVDVAAADLQAYSDGTKFAIDTRIVSEPDEKGHTTTTSQADVAPETRIVTGDILQGTFVHAGHIGDYDQNPEGLKSIKITNDQTDDSKTLTLMPEGYRSFATGVAAPGDYTVYTDDPAIGHGEGRYFAFCTMDDYSKAIVSEEFNTVQYVVKTDKLSDNFYLFPVKTIVVEKSVIADEEIMNGINMTLHFALRVHTDDGKEDEYLRRDTEEGEGTGEIWIETIEVKNGVPQSKAYFINIGDRTYDVDEVDENGNRMKTGTVFGTVVLKKIETEHNGSSDNNAAVGEHTDDEGNVITVWSDKVTVKNTFEKYKEPKPVELTVTKTFPKYYHGTDAANAVAVFKIEVYVNGENGSEEKIFDEYRALSFDESGEKSVTVKTEETDSAARIVVQEVYSSGYEPSMEAEPREDAEITAEGDTVTFVLNENTDLDQAFEVSCTNTYKDSTILTESVINTYRNGEFESSSAE